MKKTRYTLKTIYIASIVIAMIVLGIFMFNSDMFLFRKDLQGNAVQIEDAVEENSVVEEDKSLFETSRLFGTSDNVQLINKLKAVL